VTARDLEFEGKKVKADDVHASFMSALGWWPAEQSAGRWPIQHRLYLLNLVSLCGVLSAAPA
jgi:hypothetical protein